MNHTPFLIIFKKELRDLLRDRRTIITGIIIPIVLFPLIFFILNMNLKKNLEFARDKSVVALKGRNNSLFSFLEKHTNYTFLLSNNPGGSLQNSKAACAVIIPEDLNHQLYYKKTAQITIITDNTSQLSLMVAHELTHVISQYTQSITTCTTPLIVTRETMVPEDQGKGVMMLSIILPIIILIFSAMGPMATAADLGAGEKERGTLEPLLATRTGRVSIIAGKICAVSVIGLISVCSFMTGLFISYIINQDFFAAEKIVITIRFSAVIFITGITMLLTMFYGAVEFALSMYARSSKEAQIYFIPVVIITIAAAYGSIMIDVKQADSLFIKIPLINIAITIKEMLVGILDIYHIAIVILSLLSYIILAFFFSWMMFRKEEIIFRS